MSADLEKKQKTQRKNILRSADRRRIKSLALVRENRKRQRRKKSDTALQEGRGGSISAADADPRRSGKRNGFFCPVNLIPENIFNNSIKSVKGTILDISSRGMAVAVEDSVDWLTIYSDIKVTWDSSTALSGRIIWQKLEPNYLSMGKTKLVGIALYDKGYDRTPRSNKTLQATGNLKSLKSISELTGLDFYPLWIGGKDIDTGLYGFAANAHKLIANPVETRNILEILNEGFIPEDYAENAYAAYSIANDVNIDQSIETAVEAWQDYRYVTINRRRRLFLDIHENIKNHRDQLIDLMVREGHPFRLSEWEINGMVKATEPRTVDFYIDQLFKKVGVDNNEHLYLARKPDGVVCVLPPGNAPCPNSLLAVFALLAGNALIIKPPLRSPVSTMYLWRRVICDVLGSNKIPLGVVNLLIGDSERILNRWLSSAKVNDIVYFGDSRKGLEVGSRIYASGKKPILELSGNDTMVIWKDADLESAATSLVEGFLGSMQICMVARRALIHQAIYDEFESIVLRKVQAIGVGLPNEEQAQLAAVGKIEEFYEFLRDALKHGAQLIHGATRIDHAGRPNPRGMFLTPAVLRIEEISKANTMKCTFEEGFFPLLTLIRASGHPFSANLDEEIFSKMVNFLEKNLYGLRTSVWTESARYTRKFIKHV
ncbi:MAG TPA: aldehyde dehydrogenase family protein, partial [Thermodesulfobacteriota bacterium]|nr:aldehyde dehydrogenase family protein [Thermodesulfobacteriota bacterium]